MGRAFQVNKPQFILNLFIFIIIKNFIKHRIGMIYPHICLSFTHWGRDDKMGDVL